MGLKDAAQREAALKLITEHVDRLYEDARQETQRELDEAKATSGTTRVSVELPDGTALATTSRSDPRVSAKIIDHAAFVAWVRETYPTEVECRLVTEVRAPFANRILKEMGKRKAAEVADSETGELHEVPGIEVQAWGKATHSVTLADGAAEAIVAAWGVTDLVQLALPQLSGALR